MYGTSALCGLGALGALPYKVQPPRGRSPYPYPLVPVPNMDGPNASADTWKIFFKGVTGEAQSRLVSGVLADPTLRQAIDPILTGASLWQGFDTYPLPIPYADMYAPVGYFDTPVPGEGTPGGGVGASGGGGGASGGPARMKMLQGLGAASQVFPVKYPPHGYTGKGANLGNGWIQLYGNTNGNPAPDMAYWIGYCIMSRGKYVVSPNWIQYGGLKSWDASFETQQRLATQVANLGLVVVGAVAVGYAAAAALGTSSTATGAGAGAGAGGSLAPTTFAPATFTGQVAAPIATTGISVPAATLAPLASVAAPAAGVVAAGTSATSLLGTAAGAIGTAGKLAVAATGLIAATSGSKKPGIATSAMPAGTAAPASPSLLKKLLVPGAIVATLVLAFT